MTTASKDEQTGIDIPALYSRHRLYLIRMATLLVDDVATAEDVVQDAFFALHRKRDGLREPDAALAGPCGA